MPRGVRVPENTRTATRRERIRAITARTRASRDAIDAVINAPDAPAVPVVADAASPKKLDELERDHIREVLAHTGGNISRAAKILGIYRSSLQRKLKKLSLDSAA